MKKIKIILLVFALLFMLAVSASVYVAESITVTCYTGSLSDNEDLGEIEVFDIATATNECNSTLKDCEGKCTGCYIDPEGIEICIDKNGKQFKKE